MYRLLVIVALAIGASLVSPAVAQAQEGTPYPCHGCENHVNGIDQYCTSTGGQTGPRETCWQYYINGGYVSCQWQGDLCLTFVYEDFLDAELMSPAGTLLSVGSARQINLRGDIRDACTRLLILPKLPDSSPSHLTLR